MESQLKRNTLIPIGIAGLFVATAYFTAGPAVPMDNDKTSALSQQEQAKQATKEVKAAYGVDIPFPNNISLNISEPKNFVVTDSNFDTTGKITQFLSVNLKNSGSADFDANSLSMGTPVVEQDTNASCEQIFPMQKDVRPAPTDLTVKPNTTLSLDWVFTCETKPGNTITITYNVTDKDQATLSYTAKP
jgi:hypothetical protein